MNELIIINGPGVSVTTDAEEMKTQALEKAALIGVVRNADDNTLANEAARSIRSVLKAVEDARKAVKEPVLDLCRTIDATAKSFARDLADEEIRLAKAMGDWQQGEMEKIRVAERARAAELARIEAEREAQLRAAQEAADKLAREARNAAEAERIAREAEEQRKAIAERAAQAAEAVKPAPLPPKAEGQVVRPVWCYEATNIWLLARTMPALVRIDLNRQQIGEVIARLAENGEPKIPGLRIWRETKVGVRTNKQQTIDV